MLTEARFENADAASPRTSVYILTQVVLMVGDLETGIGLHNQERRLELSSGASYELV